MQIIGRKYLPGIIACLLAGVFSFHTALANDTRVGKVPAGGEFVLKAGQTKIIYGVRGEDCGDAPTFADAERDMFLESGSQPPKYGTLYDAGIGERYSNSCNGKVPVRAVGYRAHSTAGVTDEIVFFGADEASVRIRE